KLDKLSLQFALHETGREADVLEAYERLIYDAMSGDHTLFTTSEGIERLWELSTPLLENRPPVRSYPVGSWGPTAIHPLSAPPAPGAPPVRGARADPWPGRPPPRPGGEGGGAGPGPSPPRPRPPIGPPPRSSPSPAAARQPAATRHGSATTLPGRRRSRRR